MGTGADGALRECRGGVEAGGLGGTTNCGVDGVDTTDVVGVRREGEVLFAASKATG